MKTREKIAAALCACALCAVAGCAYFQEFIGASLPLFESLLAELDTALEAYEETAIAEASNPAGALALKAIQAARKALILQIIDCLASEYPNFDTTDVLERLNTASALAPHG